MGLFGKEDEYIDYTLLKKKGLLKVEEPAKQEIRTEGGFIDFTSMRNEAVPSTPPAFPAPAAAESNNNFGFLSDMASAGNSNPNTENADISSGELNALKIKVDDLDYKIARFIERIDRLEEKVAKTE
jgi:hypothetical protein